MSHKTVAGFGGNRDTIHLGSFDSGRLDFVLSTGNLDDRVNLLLCKRGLGLLCTRALGHACLHAELIMVFV